MIIENEDKCNSSIIIVLFFRYCQEKPVKPVSWYRDFPASANLTAQIHSPCTQLG